MNDKLREALEQIRKLPTIKAQKIDGEESDGTPRYWRSRPFVSLTQVERIFSEALAASKPEPQAQAQEARKS